MTSKATMSQEVIIVLVTSIEPTSKIGSAAIAMCGVGPRRKMKPNDEQGDNSDDDQRTYASGLFSCLTAGQQFHNHP